MSRALERAPRLWTLWTAARPSQLALIVLVYALGIGMKTARRGQAMADPWAVLTEPAVGVATVAVVAVSIGVHYANEYADVETDRRTERTPFSGGSGALERSGLGRGHLARASATAVAAGIGAAVWGIATGRLSTMVGILLGVIAVLGLGYSLPPGAFIRRGVGELVNAVLGGLVLPAYGAATVGVLATADVVAMLPFSCLVGCNLLATHWPDRHADASVGKSTLAVRLSPGQLRALYWTLAGVASLVTVAVLGMSLPRAVAAGQLTAIPLVLWGGLVLTRQRSPFPAVAAMVWYAVVTTAAWWWLAVVGP